MEKPSVREAVQVVDGEWVAFRGGELEGRRPRALCPSCRARLTRELNSRRRPAVSPRPSVLCFQCHRADLDRERALKAVADREYVSSERFQSALPLEPVNTVRLQRLRAARAEARTEGRVGAGRYVDRRRQAQIAARHALQRIVAGVRARQLPMSTADRAMAQAAHAAELQLPESWLPFVVAG